MAETTCPYCDHTQEEPDECYTEDELYETECGKCGKIYGIIPYYLKGYYEREMPCKNGELHSYEKLHTSREGEWQRCKYCNEERRAPK